MAIKYEICVAVENKEYKLSMSAFWKDDSKPHEMSSGYLLEYKRKDNDSIHWISECLDDDHVWRELKAKKVKKRFRKFIIKFC